MTRRLLLIRIENQSKIAPTLTTPSPTNEYCVYCGEVDTPAHTLFDCPRWHQQRFRVNVLLEQELKSENLIPLMVSNEQHWELIHDMIKTILSTKEKDERTKN
ncbi:hypothetical protein ABEB36_015566 [Hypothenemus hampei]|uniref:Reverse transcriptase zinc-binding domain-containing protein n=1 Tax=Hypothenemus hampei TaxID=57062 RepID=A0ABD1E447_HYPHA